MLKPGSREWSRMPNKAKARYVIERQRETPNAKPVPARITIALNIRGLEGPEVDRACGTEEPAVDRWEAGGRVLGRRPRRLARRTHAYRPQRAACPEMIDGRCGTCGRPALDVRHVLPGGAQ